MDRKIYRLAIFLLILLFPSGGRAEEIRVKIDYKGRTNQVESIKEGKTYLYSLRDLGAALDFSIDWQEDTRLIGLEKNNKKLGIEIDSRSLLVGGKKVKPKDRIVIKNSRTFIPISILEDYLGYLIGGRNLKAYNIYDRLDDKNLVTKLDALMELEVKENNFSGSILLAREGSLILERTYGYGDVSKKTKISPKDKLSIGSITKQFTALAILQLKEEGLLNLDDRVDMYIKDFKNGDKITIHQLLTNSSGIKDFIKLREVLDLGPGTLTRDNIIRIVSRLEGNFPPGERYEYSNSNYLVLTKVIEKVAGTSYEKYMEENIFNPLNMKDTGIHTGKKLKVRPYLGHRDKREVYEEYILALTGGAGSIYSTCQDLYKWERSLKLGKLLNEEEISSMETGHVKINKNTSYGYGWKVSQTDKGKRVKHLGNTIGFTSIIDRYPDYDLTIIIISNTGQYKLDRLSDDLSNAILGREPKKREETRYQNLDKKILDRYTGRYYLSKNRYFDISTGDNVLKLDLALIGNLTFSPLRENLFYSRDLNLGLEFNLNPKGEVKDIYLVPIGIRLYTR